MKLLLVLTLSLIPLILAEPEPQTIALAPLLLAKAAFAKGVIIGNSLNRNNGNRRNGFGGRRGNRFNNSYRRRFRHGRSTEDEEENENQMDKLFLQV